MIGIFRSAIFKRILNVGLFQALSQLANALAGLLIIRSLDKVDYAAYVLFYAVLSSISVVSGFGINMGMSVIGGRVWESRKELGILVRTLENLRMGLFKWMILPFAAYTFWLFHENSLGLVFAGFSLAVVLIIVWLQIHANLKFDVAKLLNRTDIVNRYELVPALVRLVAVAGILFFLPGHLFLVLLVTLLSYLIQYRMINGQVAGLYDPSEEESREYRKETVSFMKPDLPSTLYYVFQGQIAVVLLSVFLDTTAISDVTALGRITVLLGIVNATLAAVLLPVFAKEQDLGRLRTKFFQSSSVYLTMLSLICLVAYFFPEALLWVLGEKYVHLKTELFVMVLGSCFIQYVGFMYGIITAKGWVKYQWLYGPLTILNQVILVFLLDLHTEMGIIWFSALGTIGFFLINCVSLTLGFTGKGAKPSFS